MKRDLRRERLIAKTAGPLRKWRAPPAPGTVRLSAADGRRWLRHAEKVKAETDAAAQRTPSGEGPGPEF